MAICKHSLIASILFATTIAAVSALKFKDCGSLYGKVRSVNVTGCENTPTCILHSGSSAQLTVVFTALEDTSSARASVHGIIGGVPLPFPLPQPDGCKDSGMVCPLQNGQEYTYTASIPIRSSYPKIKVVVKWELIEASGKDLFCIEIPSAIV